MHLDHQALHGDAFGPALVVDCLARGGRQVAPQTSIWHVPPLDQGVGFGDCGLGFKVQGEGFGVQEVTFWV